MITSPETYDQLERALYDQGGLYDQIDSVHGLQSAEVVAGQIVLPATQTATETLVVSGRQGRGYCVLFGRNQNLINEGEWTSRLLMPPAGPIDDLHRLQRRDRGRQTLVHGPVNLLTGRTRLRVVPNANHTWANDMVSDYCREYHGVLSRAAGIIKESM